MDERAGGDAERACLPGDYVPAWHSDCAEWRGDRGCRADREAERAGGGLRYRAYRFYREPPGGYQVARAVRGSRFDGAARRASRPGKPDVEPRPDALQGNRGCRIRAPGL